jgi:hypothetical protein
MDYERSIVCYYFNTAFTKASSGGFKKASSSMNYSAVITVKRLPLHDDELQTNQQRVSVFQFDFARPCLSPCKSTGRFHAIVELDP